MNSFGGPPPGMRATASSCVMLSLLLAGACNLQNPGVDPPKGALNYPIGIAFGAPNDSGGHDVLFVANSNFRLRYNAGNVQAYNLEVLRNRLRDLSCLLKRTDTVEAEMDAGLAEEDAGVGALNQVDLDPSPSFGHESAALCDDPDSTDVCCFETSRDFLLSGQGNEIEVDSYASGLAVAPDGKRLYVPIRGRKRLIYLDVDKSGLLSCGDETGRCTRGVDSSDTFEDVDGTFPPEPTDVTSGPLSDLIPGADPAKVKGTFVATAHDGGQVSLFIDQGKGPALNSVLGLGVPRLNTIKPDPVHNMLYATSAVNDRVLRLGVVERMDKDQNTTLYELVNSTPLIIEQVLGSYDTRDIEADREDPSRVYVLMRGYAHALLFYRLNDAALAGAHLEGEVRVGIGASKITQATIGGRRLLLVSCYDGRAIYVIEESTRELVSVIRGVIGPFEMLVDTEHNLLYVADFRANVLRVIDVHQLADDRYPPPRVIATIGQVSSAGGLK